MPNIFQIFLSMFLWRPSLLDIRKITLQCMVVTQMEQCERLLAYYARGYVYAINFSTGVLKNIKHKKANANNNKK